MEIKENKPLKHNICVCARGIMTFKCSKCGKEDTNYLNGIEICTSCCNEDNICRICGEKLI